MGKFGNISNVRFDTYRNGVAGRPFLRIDFSFEEGGYSHPHMTAIIPSREPRRSSDAVECFVIDRDDIALAFRGDRFYDELMKHIPNTMVW